MGGVGIKGAGAEGIVDAIFRIVYRRKTLIMLSLGTGMAANCGWACAPYWTNAHAAGFGVTLDKHGLHRENSDEDKQAFHHLVYRKPKMIGGAFENSNRGTAPTEAQYYKTGWSVTSRSRNPLPPFAEGMKAQDEVIIKMGDALFNTWIMQWDLLISRLFGNFSLSKSVFDPKPDTRSNTFEKRSQVYKTRYYTDDQPLGAWKIEHRSPTEICFRRNFFMNYGARLYISLSEVDQSSAKDGLTLKDFTLLKDTRREPLLRMNVGVATFPAVDGGNRFLRRFQSFVNRVVATQAAHQFFITDRQAEIEKELFQEREKEVIAEQERKMLEKALQDELDPDTKKLKATTPSGSPNGTRINFDKA